MTEIHEIEKKVDNLLTDRGMTEDRNEPTVRQLLHHIFVALDIYRYMTVAEKNKAGYWFRLFKGSYTLTGFLKERKKRREKKNSPLHPSFKDVEGDIEISLKEKASTSLSPMRVKRTLKVRQEEFWNELLTFEGKFDRKMLLAFFHYWAEQVTGRRKMRLELETSWNTGFRLAAWSERSFAKNDEAATIRLERVKKGNKQVTASGNTEAQRIEAARREDANERLEREIEERKKNAVTYEDYLASKKKQNEEP
jgi:hypothetical protein